MLTAVERAEKLVRVTYWTPGDTVGVTVGKASIVFVDRVDFEGAKREAEHQCRLARQSVATAMQSYADDSIREVTSTLPPEGITDERLDAIRSDIRRFKQMGSGGCLADMNSDRITLLAEVDLCRRLLRDCEDNGALSRWQESYRQAYESGWKNAVSAALQAVLVCGELDARTVDVLFRAIDDAAAESE